LVVSLPDGMHGHAVENRGCPPQVDFHLHHQASESDPCS
jgi:hypothetical protein